MLNESYELQPIESQSSDRPARQGIVDFFAKNMSVLNNECDTYSCVDAVFPVIDKNQKLWLNTLALCESKLIFEVNSKPFSLLLGSNLVQSKKNYAVTMELSFAGELCYLQLSHWPDQSCLEQYTSLDMIDDLPGDLVMAIVKSAYACFTDVAEQACGAKIHLLNHQVEQLRFNNPAYLYFILKEPSGLNNCARLVFDQQLRPFIGGMLPSRTEINKIWDEKISFKIPCEIDQIFLLNSELKELSVGDILLMNRQSGDANQDVTLLVGSGLRIPAQYDTRGLTILNNENKTDLTMPVIAAKEFDQLEVELSFDIGELTLCLADLKNLQPGVILDLNRKSERLVSIRNHGQLLAEAELVEVEGRMGARISRIVD